MARFKLLAASLSLIAAIRPAPAIARETSIDARLRKLETELRQLRKEAKEARKQAQEAANAAPAAHGAADAKALPPPVFVSLKSGLSIQTADGDYSFKIGGRVFVDGGGNTQPLNGFSNQVALRNARFEVQGKAAGIYFYKLSYDFTGSGNIAGANKTLGGLRDAYLGVEAPWLNLFPAATSTYVMAGNMLEPFSLSQQSPILYQDLIERPLPVDVFTPARHIGLAAGAYGENWSFKTGVFSISLDNARLTPSPGVPAQWGVPHFAGGPATWWQPTGGSQYVDWAGRLTYAPIKDAHRLLHLGVSARFQQVNDATAANDERVLALGGRIRSEAGTLGQGLLGAPDLSCGAITAPIPTNVFSASTYAGKCTKDVETFDVEMAAASGPFSIQAEYIGSRYNRDQNAVNQAALLAALNPATAILNATGVPLMPYGRSAYFDGYYIQGLYWLTGEERAQAYDVSYKNGAVFAQLKIHHPLSAGGFGAWGVAARFSAVDLNNGPYSGNQLYTMLSLATAANNRFLATYVANAGVQGGRQQDLTVGLNWYPDPGFTFQLNWTRVMNIVAPLNGNANQSYYTGAHPNLIEMRAKMYF